MVKDKNPSKLWLGVVEPVKWFAFATVFDDIIIFWPSPPDGLRNRI